ncbi:MAG: flagellar biosynthesis anti-sigma factor FlgM [Acidobacteriota bacterium]|nr:flagellar biosynthesis anti-sigma factor FlgM [Acidobacteriota bacterium]
MRLHLDSSINGTADPRTAAVGGTGPAGTARTADGGGSRDSVSISGIATVLNQIAADRTSRIQQVSDAVRSGGYQIASAAVASSILAQASS